MKRNIFLIIIILLILFTVALFLSYQNLSKNKQNELNNQTPKQKTVDITNVDKNKLPERFPQDIPIEANAEITLNYNAINLNNKFQSTREFISAKTQEENFQFYQKVLKEKGWNITQTIEDPVLNHKIILATKDGNELNIRIYSDNNKVKVAISNETNLK
jgi:methionine-rich copper-binding protein CopC